MDFKNMLFKLLIPVVAFLCAKFIWKQIIVFLTVKDYMFDSTVFTFDDN